MSDGKSRTAHSAAISALTNARQNTRQQVFQMERSDRVSEHAIFVSPDIKDHPQKHAHAAVMDFQMEIGQPEYTVKMNDLWSQNLKRADGSDIEIDVPESGTTVEKTVASNRESVLPDRSEINTQTEHVSLETLAHKWSGRNVTVEVMYDSPYHSRSQKDEQELRVWLPPVVIKAAYRQLNSALSKIGLLAQTSAPVEHDPDPV